MKLGKFLIGTGIGLASAFIAIKMIDEQLLSPEKALKSAKESFKEKGSIDGAWIHMKPEEISKFGMTYLVYRGGISSSVHGTPEQNEFLIDAKTGTIIDVYSNSAS